MAERFGERHPDVDAGRRLLDAGTDGNVYPFGGAVDLGNATQHLGGHQAVDLEPTPDFGGYWIVDDIGRVFAFGTPAPSPATPTPPPSWPARGDEPSATPTGRVLDLHHQGPGVRPGRRRALRDMSGTSSIGRCSTRSRRRPARATTWSAATAASSPSATTQFAGSMAGKPLNAPVQSLVPTPMPGYWLVASDGASSPSTLLSRLDGATEPTSGDRMVAFGDAT